MRWLDQFRDLGPTEQGMLICQVDDILNVVYWRLLRMLSVGARFVDQTGQPVALTPLDPIVECLARDVER